jgi:hypothetical protein
MPCVVRQRHMRVVWRFLQTSGPTHISCLRRRRAESWSCLLPYLAASSPSPRARVLATCAAAGGRCAVAAGRVGGAVVRLWPARGVGLGGTGHTWALDRAMAKLRRHNAQPTPVHTAISQQRREAERQQRLLCATECKRKCEALRQEREAQRDAVAEAHRR